MACDSPVSHSETSFEINFSGIFSLPLSLPFGPISGGSVTLLLSLRKTNNRLSFHKQAHGKRMPATWSWYHSKKRLHN